MLKLIFDKDVNFFSEKNNLKVETLRMARYIQILCLSTLNPVNQRDVSHIKLSKCCDIDARLVLSQRISPTMCIGVLRGGGKKALPLPPKIG